MAMIYLKSGLSLQSTFLGGGVADADYRGNVRVILTKLSDRTKEIETGDRIAQVLFVRKEEVEFEEVATFDETDRVTKGFGSSGKQTMAKTVVEFDVAHKFVDEIVFFLLPLEKRKYIEISHVVACYFVIFVSQIRKILVVKSEIFCLKYVMKLKKVTFLVTVGKSTVHWQKKLKISIVIGILIDPAFVLQPSKRKKMSSLYAMFDDFKEHLKIQNHILTKKQTEKKFRC